MVVALGRTGCFSCHRTGGISWPSADGWTFLIIGFLRFYLLSLVGVLFCFRPFFAFHFRLLRVRRWWNSNALHATRSRQNLTLHQLQYFIRSFSLPFILLSLASRASLTLFCFSLFVFSSSWSNVPGLLPRIMGLPPVCTASYTFWIAVSLGRVIAYSSLFDSYYFGTLSFR